MTEPQGSASIGPIRLRSRRLVCENTVYSVFFDHVSDEDGHEVPEYLSISPKHAASGGVTGVGVLPLKDGKLGLIRVFRHPLASWSWEITKGFLDAGETGAQSASRELREETGFSVDPSRLIPLGFMAPEAGLLLARIQLFLAPVEANQAGAIDDELGHGDMGFFDYQEVIAMIASGDIQDGCTLSGVLKYAIKESRIAAE